MIADGVVLIFREAGLSPLRFAAVEMTMFCWGAVEMAVVVD
jgi:hypothetical protein